MKLSQKTKFLNLLRSVFMIPPVEKVLVRLTQGNSSNHFFSKLIPNHYQYPLHSWRKVKEHGITVRVDIGDYIGHCIYFGFDGTERQSYERLFSLCQPGFNVIDVGANIGYTTLVLGKQTGSGTVLGFEPDPINFDQATANLNANRLSNIRLSNKGLGETPGGAYLEERLATCRGANRVTIHAKVGIPFDMVTLDSALSEMAFGKVDLMKVDVEGYEVKVLRGAQKTLLEFKPLLFLEVDEINLKAQGDSAEALISFLRSLGYSSFLQADTLIPVPEGSDFTGCHFDLIAKF